MDIQIMLKLFHTLEQLRKHDRWTHSQLEVYQAESLQRLREHAYTYSPFYQRFHQGLMDRPLRELPVLTKAMLMEHFDELVTDRAVRLEAVRAYMAHATGDQRFLGRYRVNATSGSTGHPGLFLFDRDEWTTVLASFARAHEWAGLEVSLTHRMKMASVASTSPWHMSALVGATLKSWWMPALRLAATEPVDSIVQSLNAWQPEMLVSYASMARILADEQLAGRLQIAPHLVFTSSEVLTEETRRRIEAAWGHLLFNQYAATESGGLAAEDTHHQGMHFFEDLVIFEVVDEQNRPVLPGTYGDKLLVTALFNRTQPLIRYELSDSIRVASTPCPCGRPFALIDGIQGRVEEVLHFTTAAGGEIAVHPLEIAVHPLEIAVHPLTFHQILDKLPASGWQVLQEADGVKVLLSGMPGDFRDEILVAALRQALREQGVILPSIEVQHVPAIPKTAAGKAPLVKSNIAHATVHKYRIG
ncbi:MAG: phenylacetate--CoA ligase family protein [Chloroflexi bacterium]|nr:phenylacetate--CoA ligase family protein [Chloroflexota bacterium]